MLGGFTRGQRLALDAAVLAVMDRFDAGQRHMHGAINRCSRRRQNANYREGQVVMLGKRHLASAMGDDNRLTNLIAQFFGHLGTEYCLKRGGERPSGREAQRLLLPLPQVFEVVAIGAEHAKTTVRVTQRQRYGPGNPRTLTQCLRAIPADIVGRVADTEHRIQQ